MRGSRQHRELWNLLDAPMWSCLIEIRDIGLQDTMQLLLTEDQYVIQARSPNTPQKAFTDGIGSWRVIGCFQYLDAARCCHSSETGPKLALMIAHEILRRVSIRSRLPQLLCDPSAGGRARFTDMHHFPRFQFTAEKRKERAKEQVGDL